MRVLSLLALSLSTLVVASACDGCDPEAREDGGALGVIDAGSAPLPDAGEGDAGRQPGDAGPVVDDAGPDVDDAGAQPGDAGPAPGDAGTAEEDAGPPLACLSSRACPAPAICSDLQDEGDEVVPYCRAPEAGGAGALGEQCEAAEECESGLCLPRVEACGVACQDAALDCPGGAVCTAYPFGATSGASWIGVCAPGCGGDDDCGEGRVCTYNGNLPADVFDAVCEIPAGPGDLGAACDAATDCQAGLCLPEGCTRVCEDGSDCAGGLAGNPMAGCEDVQVASPSDDGTAILKMCR